MKFAYDISVLGRGLSDPLNRVGIHRSVESLAWSLVAECGEDLLFTAVESFEVHAACMDYLATRADAVPALVGPGAARARRAVFAMLQYACRKSLCTSDELLSIARRGEFMQLCAEARLPQRVARRLSLALHNAIGSERAWSRSVTTLGDVARVFHSPAYVLPAAVRTPARVVTVYDLIAVIHPEYCLPAASELIGRVIAGLSPDDWVVTISQCTKSDLCDHTNIDPTKVIVTHLAADSDIFKPCADQERIRTVRKRYGIPDGPYLLTISTLEPRKNFARVVRAFERLSGDSEMAGVSLVMTGAKGWQDTALEQSLQSAGIRDRVRRTGFVPDEDLAPLYSGALGFVLPSHYEGFGLPVLEALQCGVPVITSNTSSLPEIVGDAGLLVSPTDDEQIAHAMWQLVRDADLRTRLSTDGLARAAQFSWSRCASETVAVYRQAAAA